MDTQTTPLASLDSETLEQLQTEIKQEFIRILNNSNFSQILKKYGISTEELLKFQCVLDLSKIEVTDAHKATQSQGLLAENQVQNNITESEWYNPCPLEGYPQGCWL